MAKPKFGRDYWVLNSIEMWERLAFYNVRVMAPIYIMQADNPGGLHLTAADKGTIYAWWAVFQSLLPIVTGGYADRFGYKRTLSFSLVLMMTGYLLIAVLRDVPFVSFIWGFFLGSNGLWPNLTDGAPPSAIGNKAHEEKPLHQAARSIDERELADGNMPRPGYRQRQIGGAVLEHDPDAVPQRRKKPGTTTSIARMGR